MAIRPQTVANLASKFDSVVQEKVPLKKSNSRQLKLRTYDITKIINELNKINVEADKTDNSNTPVKAPRNNRPGGNIEESNRFRETTVRSGQTVGPTEVSSNQHSDTSDRSVESREQKNHLLVW